MFSCEYCEILKKPFFLQNFSGNAEIQKQPPESFYIIKKLLLEISQSSQENTCSRSIFFNKVAGPRPATLFKKRLWYRCFPVNFVKFPRTPYLQNASGRLLLEILKTITQQNTATQLMQEFSKLIITGLSYFHLLSMKIIDLVSSKIKFHPN